MALKQSFEDLNKARHAIKAFDCGKPAMNQFLDRFALKHSKLGLSHTWVLAETDGHEPATIAAYYALASATVDRVSLPTQSST